MSTADELVIAAVNAVARSCAAAVHHSCAAGWTLYGLLSIGALMGSFITVFIQVVAYLVYRRYFLVAHCPAPAGGPPPAHHHHGGAMGVPLQGMGPNAQPGAAGGWA